MTQPIFDFGRIRSNVRITEAQKEEMLGGYLKAVQQAFRETSDALVATEKNRDYRERVQALRSAAQQAVDLSRVRYQVGSLVILRCRRATPACSMPDRAGAGAVE